MMHSKLYLYLAILFVFIICSISIEQKPRKGDSALDLKKKIVAYDKDDSHKKNKDENEDEDDHVDDSYSALASYAHDRYSTFNPPEGNYRTRSRWPAAASPSSSYDDFPNGNDWSRFGYGSTFPPSISFDSNPMLSSSPTCNSLVDPQYPIFSDICGAVPQARYSLPNSFGHRERWQIAQILTNLMGSSTDPACIRSLRLLICPVLFPPCPTRHEPLPILPCQSYCRVVKARCAIPALELLPCEVLPYSSDLCPTNQPYGSFTPPGAFPSLAQSLPMAGGLPTSRSFPSLQSLLSSLLTPPPLSSVSSPSLFTAAQSTSPFNLYNGGPYATDSLNPMVGDLASRSYTNDYQQASRYAPLTRSSMETRPTTEVRRPTESRPSGVSPVVKA
jgi:hypothetical protein